MSRFLAMIHACLVKLSEPNLGKSGANGPGTYCGCFGCCVRRWKLQQLPPCNVAVASVQGRSQVFEPRCTRRLNNDAVTARSLQGA